MSSIKRPRGSIHRIREFELEKIHLVDEFDILQIVGEGWFGKILLVEHRASQTEMVLKAVPKPYVSLRDFYREFHYGLHLGIHRNIVTTYDVAFETAGFYVFTQEYAPLGDLTSNVTDTGIGELHSKRVAKQIASALDYMHSKDIVHRDVKLDNVLIYRSDFSRVKLCDFGESYQSGTVVERRNEWLPYSPPEVLQIKPEGTYKADPSHDIWQFGIVIFVCLTGCLPWQKAASDDPRYVRYLAWQGTMMLPIRRIPKLFKLLSSKATRMFRRFLEPRTERRPKTLSDLVRFMDDRWLAKRAEKDMAEYEPDELCPSMYSFHSSPDEKNRLLYTLVECGIETSVDRQTKKDRIKDWIESSIINEEDEGDEDAESASASPSSSVSREPVVGHISSIRTSSNATKIEVKTTLKDASKKHFDPRTGVLQHGPSEMGNNFRSNDNSATPGTNIKIIDNGDSLHSSILTIDSRNELNSSHMQLQNIENDTSLMEQEEPMDETINHNDFHNGRSYSSNNLGMVRNENNYVDSVTKFSIGVGCEKITREILQQTQQNDAVKSGPTYTNTYPSSSTVGNYASTSSNTNIIKHYNKDSKRNNSKSNPNKSVTFVGLANAFESLAHISLPSDSIVVTANDTIPGKGLTYLSHYNDSQVKDSGYGSCDKIRSPLEDTSEAKNALQKQENREWNVVKATPECSPLAFNSTVTMKDSPYDQIKVSKKKK